MIMYKTFLNKEKAEEIFNAESLYLGSGNVIPCYRVTEMFGEWIREFAVKNLESGGDFNAWGDCRERPLIFYFHKSGFMKIVAERNYLLMADEIKENGLSGVLSRGKKEGIANE